MFIVPMLSTGVSSQSSFLQQSLYPLLSVMTSPITNRFSYLAVILSSFSSIGLYPSVLISVNFVNESRANVAHGVKELIYLFFLRRFLHTCHVPYIEHKLTIYFSFLQKSLYAHKVPNLKQRVSRFFCFCQRFLYDYPLLDVEIEFSWCFFSYLEEESICISCWKTPYKFFFHLSTMVFYLLLLS